jgi:hypothetical protein
MYDSAMNHRATSRGGLGQSGLHNLLELELLNRTDVPGGLWGSWGVRPAGLAAILI